MVRNHIPSYLGGQIFGPVQISGEVTSACRLVFDPPKFLIKINNHVIESAFWSILKLSGNPLLVQFEQKTVDQKRVFEQFEHGPKVEFDHVIINFEIRVDQK